MDVEKGMVIAGKLRLSRALAKGGMGAVWVARHLLLDKDVALKLMRPAIAASDTARARFRREAQALLLMEHPNVVQALDYGFDGGTPYIVMELLEGEDLATRLERVGRLSPAEAYALLAPLEGALSRTHAVGLVHRDLKPSNVFLARSGGEEILKMLDFGIAKQLDPKAAAALTKTGVVLGSPRYMSPEQARHAREVDHRSDLYSLGAILYHALTGRAPHDGYANLAMMLVAISAVPPPPPSSVQPELGPEVDQFFARALAIQPGDRFQSATELVAGFARLVDRQ